MNVVQTILPHAKHRHCARHIFAKWHKSFKRDENKLLFWKVAKAYNMADYNEVLDEMENLNHVATVRFKGANPKVFCRAFLKTDIKGDVIVNNLVETFNGNIINARTKHLIYMLEDIRTSLMQRFVMKRQEMEKTTFVLCPRIQAKLDKEDEEVVNCFPMPSRNLIFLVNHKMDYLTVDMGSRTCTCKKLNMCGIPCFHAISYIFFLSYEC